MSSAGSAANSECPHRNHLGRRERAAKSGERSGPAHPVELRSAHGSTPTTVTHAAARAARADRVILELVDAHRCLWSSGDAGGPAPALNPRIRPPRRRMALPHRPDTPHGEDARKLLATRASHCRITSLALSRPPLLCRHAAAQREAPWLVPLPCRAGVARHACRGERPRPSSLFTVTGSVRRQSAPSSYSSTCFMRGWSGAIEPLHEA